MMPFKKKQKSIYFSSKKGIEAILSKKCTFFIIFNISVTFSHLIPQVWPMSYFILKAFHNWICNLLLILFVILLLQITFNDWLAPKVSWKVVTKWYLLQFYSIIYFKQSIISVDLDSISSHKWNKDERYLSR